MARKTPPTPTSPEPSLQATPQASPVTPPAPVSFEESMIAGVRRARKITAPNALVAEGYRERTWTVTFSDDAGDVVARVDVVNGVVGEVY